MKTPMLRKWRAAELDSLEPAPPEDPDAVAVRAGQLVADLVEPAKSEALEKLGEGRQALDIAAGWVRAKLLGDKPETPTIATSSIQRVARSNRQSTSVRSDGRTWGRCSTRPTNTGADSRRPFDSHRTPFTHRGGPRDCLSLPLHVELPTQSLEVAARLRDRLATGRARRPRDIWRYAAVGEIASKSAVARRAFGQVPTMAAIPAALRRHAGGAGVTITEREERCAATRLLCRGRISAPAEHE
jgi:hypothetical protein